MAESGDKILYRGKTQIYLPRYYRALKPGDELEVGRDVPVDEAPRFLARSDFQLKKGKGSGGDTTPGDQALGALSVSDPATVAAKDDNRKG